MPSYSRSGVHREKPWHARVQLNNKYYFLGYYQSKGEAIRREEKFKRELHQITAEAQALWRKCLENYSTMFQYQHPPMSVRAIGATE